MYYVTQYYTSTPTIRTLETPWDKHRKLSIHRVTNDNIIAILDSSGSISLTWASKINEKIEKNDSEISKIESEEGEGESESDDILIEFDKTIPLNHQLLAMTISKVEDQTDKKKSKKKNKRQKVREDE